MPDAPLVIFTPPSSSTPTAPGVVYTAPSGGGEPAAPGVVYTLPSDGSVAATLTVNPTGADNSVLFTAVTPGTGGNAISVTYATPASVAATAVAVVGNAITVTPATKAKMVVAGTLSPDATGTLFYAGLKFGHPNWTHDGVPLNSGAGTQIYSEDGTLWILEKTDSGSSTLFDASGTGVSPEGLTWTPATGTGTPTVTAGTSSAAQVIAAVMAATPAAALVTASASGTVTGAVAAVTAANLSGGVGGVAAAPVIFTPPG